MSVFICRIDGFFYYDVYYVPKVSKKMIVCDRGLQLRTIPVKPAEDDELEEEAEWIYRNAFSTPTISMQVL